MVSANMNQTVQMDSIHISLDSYPYGFRYFGKQKVIRSTSIVTRKLVTSGQLRHIDRSDHNPHGFLVENWETISNETLKSEKR